MSDVTHDVAIATVRERTSRASQVVTLIAVGVPPVGVLSAMGLLWGVAFSWLDVVLFVVLYTASALGNSVGFHRLFTHRSFKTTRWMRGLLAILGSAAMEGAVIEWVATHRKHHRFSDRPGDPHSPHEHGSGWRGAAQGLYHAHVGWTMRGGDRASAQRYAKDLSADPVVRFVSSTFLLWVIAGGGVRIFLLHHVTFSINSLCHFFGRRRFATGDESRNLAWLAPLSLGESWHNNHHAFPTSAAHGMSRWELDPSALFITALERVGLAWDVVRITPERRAAKLA